MQKLFINLIVLIILIFALRVARETNEANAAVINPGIACGTGYAVICPQTGMFGAPSCVSHFQCGAPLFHNTCTVANGADTLDTVNIYSVTPFCGTSSGDVITCRALQCPDSSQTLHFKNDGVNPNGLPCTVRIARADGMVLEDTGVWFNDSNSINIDQCLKCSPPGGTVVGGVTLFNIQTALCGDTSGLYLDSTTGECNGGIANTFNSLCGTISASCDGKKYQDNCNVPSCGTCDARGQCVLNGPCKAADPTISGIGTQTGAPGSTLTYNFNITNNSRGTCSNVFNLGFSGPAGWTGTFPINPITIAGCITQSVLLNVTAPLCATPGTYTFTITTTGNGKTASKTGTFQVSTASLCSIWPNDLMIAAGNSTNLNWTTTAGVIGATINPGSINAPPPSGSVSVSPATTTTYTMDLLSATCGTIANACNTTVTVCAANWKAACTSPNGCFSGTYACDGVTCVDGTGNPLPSDSYYGTACNSANNNCNQHNSGQEDCDHFCVNPLQLHGGPVVASPPNAAGCTTPANACGASNSGFECLGPVPPNACTDSNSNPLFPPPNPPFYGNYCEEVNYCGVKNTGARDCSNVCVDGLGNVVAPPPNPPGFGNPCTSLPNACGATNNGTIGCSGCSAVIPPVPPNYGTSCTSAPNSCGLTADGIIDCVGNCSATAPPPVPIGGLVPCGRLCDDPATTFINETKPCDLCAAFYMLKKALNFAMEIAVGIAVFIIIIGGLLYAFSAGDSGRMEMSRSAIAYAISGVALIFTAWLIVAILLQVLGYGNMAAWNQVNCALQT